MIRKTFQFVMFNGKCLQNIPHKKASIVDNSFRNKLIEQVIVLMIKYLNDNLLFKKKIEKYQIITGKYSKSTMSQRSMTTCNTARLSKEIR